MNYRDSENILLIICGAMGIAALALIFRYLFIGLGFDVFGANLVFIIVFVIGLIFYISYLELIQKVGSRFFKKKQKTDSEFIITESESKPIENTEPDLNSIREKHQQNEAKRKQEVLDIAIQYTRTTFAPFADNQNINCLCEYIIQYSTGTELKNVEPVRVKDLQNIDLYHFGWNIWNHFRINTQEDIALFLKIVFSKKLEDVDTDTIRKKLTFDEGKSIVKLRKQF